MTSSSPPPQPEVPWWTQACAVTAPVVLAGAWLYAAGAGSGIDAGRAKPPELTMTPGWWVTPAAVTITGVAYVLIGAGLRPADRSARALLAAGGALTVLSGWMPVLGRTGFWHTNVTNLALVTLCVWPALVTPERPQIPAVLQRRFGESLAVGLGALLLLYVGTRTDPLAVGSSYSFQHRLLMTAQATTPLMIVLGLAVNALRQRRARVDSNGGAVDGGLRRVHRGQLGADQHQRGVGVVRLGDGGQAEVGDDARAEHEAVGRPAELEVAELVAFADMTSGRDVGADHAG